MTGYKVGDKVEYHPIGGASPNVSASKGEIVDVQGSGDETRYGIKNDNTGKTTRKSQSKYTNARLWPTFLYNRYYQIIRRRTSPRRYSTISWFFPWMHTIWIFECVCHVLSTCTNISVPFVTVHQYLCCRPPSFRHGTRRLLLGSLYLISVAHMSCLMVSLIFFTHSFVESSAASRDY
ncbi:hypothetical protein K439DRAFT_760301 [Ramaria rubella]|nr:hypothetical protein K439DRAFT_763634 [Ramaria rubella]KAF8575236.1 hypothetical protein K439DRAFT_760301 [Ramaria rubella]